MPLPRRRRRRALTGLVDALVKIAPRSRRPYRTAASRLVASTVDAYGHRCNRTYETVQNLVRMKLIPDSGSGSTRDHPATRGRL